MRYGFLFPGQGAQHVGMGRDLYEKWEASRSVFDRANEALGFDLTRISFEGPADELVKTVNAQPAIVTHSVAVWSLLAAEGIRPDFVAGHSVGEYSALVAAGALAFEDAVQLVRRRGELMYRAGIDHPGTMSAIVGLDEDTVARVCREAASQGEVQTANLNSPDQIVISGSPSGVEDAERRARDAGAKRVVRLDVSGAFHSALMEDAQVGLSDALDRVSFSDPVVPVVANVDARPRRNGAEIRDALDRQLTSPVRWADCMDTLIGEGCEAFVELGPGRVLSGLLRRIDRRRTVFAAGDVPSVEGLWEQLGLREGAES